MFSSIWRGILTTLDRTRTSPERPGPVGGDKRRHAALGYHQVGEFYYCTVYHQGTDFLGSNKEEKFQTHESFAGLVTAVHEHYHLMQEMLQGYSWWRHETRDAFAGEAIKQLKKGGSSVLRYPLCPKPDEDAKYMVIDESDPFVWAKKYWLELKSLDRYTDRPETTRLFLDIEMEESPELARLINEDAYNLTTIDLLECQAALLTELYLSKLIAEEPERFDLKIIKEMAPLFRLDEMMENYSRPLRALLHVMQSLKLQMQFTVPGHPLYEQMAHGLLYVLLAFLIDYSLHLPPEPFALLDKHPDGSTRQDIYPPFRFLNLMFMYLMELTSGTPEIRQILTSERLYYSKVGPLLARAVNGMHNTVRGSGAPNTFFSIDDTTQMWAERIAKNEVCRHFPESAHVRQNCWEYRKRAPDTWLHLKPSSFDITVGLPILNFTPRGLISMPYFADEGRNTVSMSSDELREHIIKMIMPHLEAKYAGGSWEAGHGLTSTVYPEKFIRESMQREMTERLALAILFEGELRCPLTETIGKCVPCGPRTANCERIVDLQALPGKECLLYDVCDQYFGGIGRFQKEQ